MEKPHGKSFILIESRNANVRKCPGGIFVFDFIFWGSYDNKNQILRLQKAFIVSQNFHKKIENITLTTCNKTIN